MDSLLPALLRTPRMLAFEAAAARVAALKAVAVYDVDNVPASALYDLADQFNVLGNRGWNLADTELKKRTLVKRAIELHRTAGTPFAVKRALDAVGYPDAVIIENPGLRYDGSATYNGQEVYRGDAWGQFIIVLDSVQSVVSVEKVRQIIALINEWKNLRSVLLDLRIGEVSLIENPLLYDGTVGYDGSEVYDGSKAEL